MLFWSDLVGFTLIRPDSARPEEPCRAVALGEGRADSAGAPGIARQDLVRILVGFGRIYFDLP